MSNCILFWVHYYSITNKRSHKTDKKNFGLYKKMESCRSPSKKCHQSPSTNKTRFFITHNLIYMKKRHFYGKRFYNRLPEEITEMGNI